MERRYNGSGKKTSSPPWNETMSLVQTIGEIEYPETDGQPMGETDLHRNWMFRILELLRYRYRGQQVYVASDLLVYYHEGFPHEFVVPDVFVVKDSDPGERRTYKIWEENDKAPDVVIEVTSLATQPKDSVRKPQIYSDIGVKEYFLYDPTSDYLEPPLQGFKPVAGKHQRIEADASGALVSEELGVTLRLDGDDLVMHDTATGELVLTEAEAAHAEAEAAHARADAAERRAEKAEQELQRLREQLKRQSGNE
jgi:Uma2 family endonuclease